MSQDKPGAIAHSSHMTSRRFLPLLGANLIALMLLVCGLCSVLLPATAQAAQPPAPALTSLTPGDQAMTVNWNWTANTDGTCLLNDAGSGWFIAYRQAGTDWHPPTNTATGGTFFVTNSPALRTFTVDANAAGVERTGAALTNGVEYEVRMIVFSQSCNEYSSYSNPLYTTPEVVPDAPTNLQAAAGDTQITLTWTLPTNAGKIDNVQVRHKVKTEANFGAWSNLPGTATTTTVNNLTNGTEYTFEVRAKNTAGEGSAASIDATPALPAPDAPTNLTAAGDTKITLTWTLPTNTSQIDNVQVRHKVKTEANFGVWSDLGATATTTTVNNLTNGTEYTFEVRAVNTAGAATASIDATPALAIPDAPTNLQAAAGDTQITLTWALPTNASVIDNVQVRHKVKTAANFGAWSNLDATATTTDVTGLTNGTEYTFEVRAKNTAGDGAAASIDQAPNVVPDAPTNLTATAGRGQVSLSWTLPTSAVKIDNMQVRHKVKTAATWGAWSDLAGTATTTTVTRLRGDTQHSFEVRAKNTAGESPAASVDATPSVLHPAAPVITSISSGDQALTINWSWTDDTGGTCHLNDLISGWEIQYKKKTVANWVKPNPSQMNTAEAGTFEVRDAGAGRSFTVNIDADINPHLGQIGINLANGIEYELRILAYSQACERPYNPNSPYSNVVTATPLLSAPDVPTNLTATAGNGQISLSWTLPTNASTIDNIQVRHKVKTAANFGAWSDLVGTATTTDVTGLTNGTEYTFEVRAKNTAGESAAASVDATPDAVPDAPTNLTATVGNKQVTLSWTLPTNVGKIDKLQVAESYSDGTGRVFGAWTDVPGNPTTVTTVGLTNGREYTFEVRAVNSAGEGKVASVKATPDVVPGAPTSLAAEVGDKKIRLTWTLPTSTDLGKIDNVQVRHKVKTAANFGAWSDLAGTATTTDVTGLTNGTEYSFEVRAKNTAGEGVAASVDATPDTVPDAPTNLTAAVGDTQITLSWTLPTTTSAITQVQVRHKVKTETNWGSWSDLGATATTTDVTGLTNGTEYTFEVRAVNAMGNGLAASVDATPDVVPGVPTNLTAAVGDTQITLNWTLPTNTGLGKIDNMQVRHRVKTATNWEPWSDVSGGGSATTTTVGSLTNGTEYSFQVRAVNTAGAGAAASVDATPYAVPGAPTNLTAEVGHTQITLNWTLPTNTEKIDNVQVRHKVKTETAWGAWRDLGATATTTDVTGLTNETEYSFEVRAVNAAGDGPAASVDATPIQLRTTAPVITSITAGDQALTINWSWTDDTGGTCHLNNPNSGWEIQYKKKTATRWITANASETNTAEAGTFEVRDAGAGRSFTINIDAGTNPHLGQSGINLTNGIEYELRMRAYSQACERPYNPYSLYSSVATATPLLSVPDAPTNLTAAAGDKKVTLSWTLPTNASEIDNIQVRHKVKTAANFGAWSDLAGTATTTDVTGLTNGTEYSFEVRAKNTAGDGPAASVDATPDVVPAAPTNLTATVGNTQITLNWTLPANTGLGKIDNVQMRHKVKTATTWGAWSDLAGTATTTDIIGLTNGTEYSFEVRAVNTAGEGAAASVDATPDVVPAAPTDLTATVGNTQITLNWTLPTNTGLGKIDNVQLRHKIKAAANWGTWRDLGSTTTTTVPNLTNGTEYSFQVRAVNTAGDGPAASVDATPDVVPAAPTNLTAAVGDTQITLTWGLPTNTGLAKIDNVQVRHKIKTAATWGAWSNLAGTATTTDVTGLTNGTEYSFEVRAVNTAGEGAAASVDATPDVVPGVPTNLTATVGNTQITLAWTLPTNTGLGEIDNVQVRHKIKTAATWGAWSNLAGTATTTDVTGLTNGTEYSFQVRAVNSAGEGTEASVDATPDVVLAAPTNLTAILGDQKITLNWTLPANTGLGKIDNMQVRHKVKTAATWGAWSDLAGNATTTTVDSLTNATEYSFEVRGVNTAGAGAAASVDATPVVAVPDAPTNLTAAGGDKKVTLTWTLPTNASAIDNVQVRHKVKTETNWGAWSDLAGTTTTTDVTGLTNGTEYSFEVRAVNTSGDGAAASVDATPDVVPAAPTNLTAAVGNTQITLNWTLPTNAGKIDNVQVRHKVKTAATWGAWSDLAGTATTTTVERLTNGTEYSFEVRAVNTAGDGAAASVDATPDVVPAAPTNLTAQVGNTQITLNWTLPTNAGLAKIDNVQVRHKVKTAANWGAWSDLGATATTTTVGSLTNGTEYSFEVRAVNTAGAGAAASVDATPNVVPVAPTNLTAAVGDTQVTLTWTLPGGTLTGLQVRHKVKTASNWGAWSDLAGTATTTDVTGLTNGTEYSFEVRAVNTAGDGPAASVDATPDVVPGVPTNLTAAVGDTQITLTWTLPTNTGLAKIGNVQVRHKVKTAANWGAWSDLAGTATTTTVGSLTNGTEYSFEVRAVNTAGDGPAASVDATPDAVPAAPTNLTAAVGDTQITLNWTLPANTGLGKIDNVQMRHKVKTATNWGIWRDLGSTTTTTVPNLTNGTEYSFQVRALNTAGDGPAASVDATPDVVPGVPTDLTAAVGDTQITLTWGLPTNAGLGKIDNVQVRHKIKTATNWGAWSDLGATATTTTVGSLTNGTEYSFEVRAVNTAGAGAAASADATPDVVPGVPTNLTTAVGDGQITLTWGLPTNAGLGKIDNVQVRYKIKTAATWGSWSNLGATATTTTVSSLTNGTEYSFEVRAVNTAGNGAAASVDATPDVVPGVPTDLTAAVGDTQITLTWTLPSNTGLGKIDNVQVRHKIKTAQTWGDWSNLGATATTTTVGSLTNGTEYSFEVRAVNTARDGPAASVDATPDVVPGVPTGLTAAVGNTQITLTWTLPTNTGLGKIDNVQVRHKIKTASTWGSWSNLGATATTTTVSSLTNGTEYTFEVRAVNTAGDGPAASADATPDAVPAAPTNLAAAVRDRAIELTWVLPTNRDLGKIDNVQVRHKVKTASTWGAWSNLGATATTTTVSSLTNGTEYSFQVRAVNTAGDGAAASVDATPDLVPDAPTNLTAEVGNTQITLTWVLPTNVGSITNMQVRHKVQTATRWGSWTNLAGTATTTTVERLTNGTEYSFEVRAVNTAGEGSAASVDATPDVVPDAPTNLAAAVGDQQITLTWGLPTNAGLGKIDNVQVRHKVKTATNFGAWSNLGATATTTTVGSLTNGTAYSFEVRAVNTAGEGAAASLDATPDLTPVAPTNLTATVGNTQITLNWGLPTNVGTIAQVQVRHKVKTAATWGGWSDLSATATTTDVTGLTNGTEYSFQVRAVNTAGEGAEASVNATPDVVPGAPTNLTATAGNAQVTLTWRLPTNTGLGKIDNVQVRHKVKTATSWGAWSNLVGRTTTTTVGSLTNGTEYSFEVRAVNTAGEGTAASVDATPELVPGVPTNLTAAAGDAQVTLTWTLPTNNGLGKIDNVQVRHKVKTATNFGAWSDLAGTATTTTVGSLTNGTEYTFQVRAVNTAGQSRAASVDATPDVRPGAPTNLTATVANRSSTLSWTLPTNAGKIDKMQVRHKVKTATNFGAWSDLGAAATSVNVRDLTNGTEYTFQVRAVNTAGNGPAASVNVTPDAIPSQVTNLAAAAGDTQITLTWTLPTNATAIDQVQVRHKVKTATNFGNWSDLGAAATTTTITGLTNATEYSFQVRAVNAAGEGRAASVDATPVLPAPDAPTGLTARAGNAQVALSWTLPTNTSEIDHVQVRHKMKTTRRFGAWSDLAGTATTTTVNDLVNDTEYTFEVRAVNTAGAGAAASVDATPVTRNFEAERRILRDTLAGFARGTLNSAATTLGQRFDVAPGTREVTFAGRSVSLRETPEAGRLADARKHGGAYWERHSETLGRDPGEFASLYGTSGSDDPDGLSAFTMAMDGGDSGAAQRPWTLWGRGDLQNFEAETGAGDHDGSLSSGWIGADMRLNENSLLGLAVSRSKGEAEYNFDGGAGDLDVTFTSLWPYLRFDTQGGGSLRLIFGVGAGDAEQRPSEQDEVERADLSMAAFILAARRPLRRLGVLSLSLTGDAGISRMKTDADSEALAGLEATVWQVRGGVEARHEELMVDGTDMRLVPFGSLSLRHDGGDGATGTGLELAGGFALRAPGSRLGLDAHGRWLGLRTGDDTSEWSGGVEVTLLPKADGQGLSLAVGPRWGTQNSGALKEEHLFTKETENSEARSSLSGSVGYGVTYGPGLLTPYGQFDVSDDDSNRQRLGARFDVSGSDQLSLDLAGERREDEAGDEDYQVGVKFRVKFPVAQGQTAPVTNAPVQNVEQEPRRVEKTSAPEKDTPDAGRLELRGWLEGEAPAPATPPTTDDAARKPAVKVERKASAAPRRVYRIQVAAVRTKTAAVAERKRLARKLSRVLAGDQLKVEKRATTRNLSWRVVLAREYSSFRKARTRCAALKAGGGDCYVRRAPRG